MEKRSHRRRGQAPISSARKARWGTRTFQAPIALVTILWADAGASKIDPKVIAKSKKDPNAPLPVANPIRQRLRLPGPVRYLFPLTAGKGASYVSEFGGFGAARFADEEVP